VLEEGRSVKLEGLIVIQAAATPVAFTTKVDGSLATE
jgi:hypothetical protein